MHRRSTLLTLLLLAVPVIGIGLWLRSARRQYSLNRQLIDALMHTDDRQALALVNEGADPNTRYKPTQAPTLPDLMRQFFHRSAPPANDSPTALAMACGAIWADDDATIRTQQDRPDAPQLVQAMLAHGADVTAKMDNGWGDKGWTPLMWAVGRYSWNYAGNPNSVAVVRCLLAHGANPNVVYGNGDTPLSTVEFIPELKTLLRRYGAKK